MEIKHKIYIVIAIFVFAFVIFPIIMFIENKHNK